MYRGVLDYARLGTCVVSTNWLVTSLLAYTQRCSHALPLHPCPGPSTYVKHLGADKYRFKDTGGAGTLIRDTRGHTGTHRHTDVGSHPDDPSKLPQNLIKTIPTAHNPDQCTRPPKRNPKATGRGHPPPARPRDDRIRGRLTPAAPEPPSGRLRRGRPLRTYANPTPGPRAETFHEVR